MKVLQIGSENWEDKYEIPQGIEWDFNTFPTTLAGNKKYYEVVIITGAINLDKNIWEELQKIVYPYNVLILPGLREKLNDAGKFFLKCKVAEDITEDIQTLINHLKQRYFFGQFGYRFFPTDISLNESKIKSYSYQDSGHLQMIISSPDDWINIGTYRYSIALIHDRITKLWLEARKKNIQLRLKVFIRDLGYEGDPLECKTLSICDSPNEAIIPVPVSDKDKNMTVTIQAKGSGKLTIGLLHSRWSREGKGTIVTGGKRIVNLSNFEDIAYYFDPGDLKPPLNVYFTGANWTEGFQGLGLFRRLGTPTLLFTDLRLEAGQFYDDIHHYMIAQVKQVILKTLKKLNFDESQLIMNGGSMGSYAAMKLGAELQAYVININKPIGSIGYVARRSRLQRPDNYETSLDIVKELMDNSKVKTLKQLDDQFWNEFNQSNLSKTRLLVTYKKNDDYDNAINKLISSPAVQKALQFSYKGFPGRHIDGKDDIEWFIARIRQVLNDDFGREL